MMHTSHITSRSASATGLLRGLLVTSKDSGSNYSLTAMGTERSWDVRLDSQYIEKHIRMYGKQRHPLICGQMNLPFSLAPRVPKPCPLAAPNQANQFQCFWVDPFPLANPAYNKTRVIDNKFVIPLPRLCSS